MGRVSLFKWLRHYAARAVLVAAALTVVVAIGVGMVGWRHSDLLAPAPGQLLLDRHGRFLANFASPDVDAGYGYWPLPSLPERVVAATLALEDRRFHRHPGVDPLAALRAIRQNAMAGRRVSGASTLAMQVARLQLNRTSGRTERTYMRKLTEAAAAICMTVRHGRDALLRHYLRLVPYGNRIHGIGFAARAYLGKPVADLSWAEIALLASIPPSPTRGNPYHLRGREYLRGRAERILTRLARVGVLGPAEHVLAREQLARTTFLERPERPYEALHAIERAGAALATVAKRFPQRVAQPLHSELDLGLQGWIHDTAGEYLRHWRSDGAANVAVMVVDVDSGAVRAALGSAGYHDQTSAGAIDFTRVPRSPGSTLKPFIYALALEQGLIAPDSVLADLPDPAGIQNADRRYLGPMLPRRALANSRNVPAAALVRRLGLAQTYWGLAPLGLIWPGAEPEHYGLGLALGAMPSTLADLTAAYAALARGGNWQTLRHLSVADAQVSAPSGRGVATLSAALVNQFLSDPQARLPTFKRMGATRYPYPVALKTGTSQGYRDAWTFVWTPEYVVGVWVGRPDAAPMRDLGGADSAAWLARAVMLHLHGGSRPAAFPAPAGMEPRQLCMHTGALAGPGCARNVREWLAHAGRPAAFERVAIDTRTGREADRFTPTGFVAVRDLIGLDARFRGWQLARTAPGGLPRASPTLRAPRESASVSSPPLGPTSRPTTPVKIESPTHGLRVVMLPSVPAALQSVPLRLASATPSGQVVWYVDGVPFKTAETSDTVRWPLEPGRHTIRAVLANSGAVSRNIRIEVRQ
ncbi:MAG: transglycosylase domain-containing protein [Pseudomonadota bacterium]